MNIFLCAALAFVVIVAILSRTSWGRRFLDSTITDDPRYGEIDNELRKKEPWRL